jgi:prolipoprotein diacylglyceryltransferase
MRPILFSLGSLNFYSFGFFVALGFILSGMVMHYLAKKKRLLTSKIREYFLFDALLIALAAGFVGARLLYAVLYNIIFRTEPISQVTNLFGGGFVFYGGLAAAFIALYYWFKKHDMTSLVWLDVSIIGLLTGLVATQFGSYLNDGQFIHLAEMVGYGVIGGVSYQTFRVEKKAGTTFAISLFLIFLFRFFLGFWSIEAVSWIGLGLGQWASLLGIFMMTSTVFKQLNQLKK